MKVSVEYQDTARGEMHRLVKKLEQDIEALGTVRIYSRFRIVGSDGCEILHNSAEPGKKLMKSLHEPINSDTKRTLP